MLKKTYLIVIIVLVFQFGINEAKLAAMPKIHATSACLGDTVTLEIEITQSEGLVAVTWRHGADVLYDDEHYTKSEGGRKLTILDVLPPHSGLYHARVQDDKSVVNVGFTVDVKNIFMRLLVKSSIRVPIGATVKLKLSRSDEGVLWWTHDGHLVRATEYLPSGTLRKTDHYYFHGTTGNFLEISDTQIEHAGRYEAILKSGDCEVRNVMQVIVGELDIAETEKSEEFFTEPVVAIIIGTVVIVIVVLIVIAFFFVRAKLEERRQQMKSDATVNSSEPIYDTIYKESIFDIKEHSCGNQEDLTAQMFQD